MAQQFNYPNSETELRATQDVLYREAKAAYRDGGTWKQCTVWYRNGGAWVQVVPYYRNGGTWIRV